MADPVSGAPGASTRSRAYLDHASTSPARPEVVEAVLPWLTGTRSADPGRVHTEGRTARAAIEDARDRVAALLGCRSSREVIFTSGLSESAAAVTWGAVERARASDPHAQPAVVASAVEHSALRSWAERARRVDVPVDRLGRIDLGALVDAVGRERPALVHCQWGNHEVGTLQPVADVVAACRESGTLVHVDATQAAGRVPVGFADLGADLLSVEAHLLGGPKGIGALLVRRGLRLPPLLVGGDQERGRRAGLEDVASIVGFGAAADVLLADSADSAAVDTAGASGAASGTTRLHHEAAEQSRLTQRLLDSVAEMDGVSLYGDVRPDGRLPHIACLAVDGVEAEPVLLSLDQAGVAVHSGSSCSSEALEPSPVLEAMGVDAERSLRASVGWSSTDADIDRFASALPAALERLRALRG